MRTMIATVVVFMATACMAAVNVNESMIGNRLFVEICSHDSAQTARIIVDYQDVYLCDGGVGVANITETSTGSVDKYFISNGDLVIDFGEREWSTGSCEEYIVTVSDECMLQAEKIISGLYSVVSVPDFIKIHINAEDDQNNDEAIVVSEVRDGMKTIMMHDGLRVYIQDAEYINIQIYDLKGRLIEAVDVTGPELRWDGKLHTGGHMTSGVYLYKMKTNAGEKRGKILNIK